MDTIKNNPRIMRSWCMYDWANSVFSLTIGTTLFPIYFQNATAANGGIISLAGISFKNTVVYSFVISFSFLLVAFINPLLSGLSDVAGLRKKFMTFFTILGCLSSMSLFGFTESTIGLGVIGFAFATMGYAGSLVFYNAYLPEIATPDRLDKLSARGFAMGYIGGVLLLIINLLTIHYHDFLGLKDEMHASRIAFLTVGIWWLFFGIRSIMGLPGVAGLSPQNNNIWYKGYLESRKVWIEIRKNRIQMWFLTAFFFYSMGTQTILYVAALFGADELKMPAENLIISILLIQFVGIVGAYLFAYVSQKKGTFFSISIMIVVWLLVCIGAYFTYHGWQFYILAVAVGTVMGGIQSQSRSAFASIIPGKKDNASYYSFYELSEKIATVLGTLSFGILIDMTGSMRSSILLLTLFFIIGLVMMVRLNLTGSQSSRKAG
jgi:UMF1 family MFS transporter